MATSVPLITDNSRKARGARDREKENDDDNGLVKDAERVRKGAGVGRERVADVRIRDRGETEVREGGFDGAHRETLQLF